MRHSQATRRLVWAANPERDGDDKLIGRSYWLDLSDRSIVLIMTQGIGRRLTADERPISSTSDGRT